MLGLLSWSLLLLLLLVHTMDILVSDLYTILHVWLHGHILHPWIVTLSLLGHVEDRWSFGGIIYYVVIDIVVVYNVSHVAST